MRYPTVAGLSALALSSSAVAKPLLRSRDNATKIYDFASLTPSANLEWTPCFEDFTCTLLEVPLDYEDEEAGTTEVAFIKWSTNSTNSSGAQDILINPGGPGGSGVQFLRFSIDLLLNGLGTENNLVGFDPRGVNNSGPDLSCFPGRTGTSRFYDEDYGRAVDANSTTSLVETFAQAGAFGQWCSAVHAGANSTAKYANTVATATDMLHYTELLAESNGESKDESQLWYYGASYGTVLGSTYAALFPDRIGRMVLDAVVDVEDYYQGKWEANLKDADAAVSTFFKYCYEGGEDECDFWEDSEEAIKDRFHAVLQQLKDEPVIVTDPLIVDEPTIVTITDFKTILVSVPYSPYELFPVLASLLVELENGVGDTLAQFTGAGSNLQDTCGDSIVEAEDLEPRQFIACTDANGRFNLSTMDKWIEHVDLLVDESEYLGEAWAAGTSINCRSLNISAPKSQVFDGVPSADETSWPILFIGNTLDPVTPHSAAEKMTKLFGGARLLTQDSVGHASVSAVSACTTKHLREYIKSGDLPDEGTVCEPDTVPFEPVGNSTTQGQGQAGAKILRRRNHV